jgi:ATP-dependent DNA ligase
MIAGSAVEIVACNEKGKSNFFTLIRKRASGVCVWCFDLLILNNDDLRPLPLQARKSVFLSFCRI